MEIEKCRVKFIFALSIILHCHDTSLISHLSMRQFCLIKDEFFFFNSLRQQIYLVSYWTSREFIKLVVNSTGLVNFMLSSNRKPTQTLESHVTCSVLWKSDEAGARTDNDSIEISHTTEQSRPLFCCGERNYCFIATTSSRARRKNGLCAYRCTKLIYQLTILGFSVGGKFSSMM